MYRLYCEEGLGAAPQAAKADTRGGEPPRARQGDSAESGLEAGLRRVSASGRDEGSVLTIVDV